MVPQRVLGGFAMLIYFLRDGNCANVDCEGECFSFWNKTIIVAEDDGRRVLEKVLFELDGHLDLLQKLMSELSAKKALLENETKNLDTLSDSVNVDVGTVTKDIVELMRMLEGVKKALEELELDENDPEGFLNEIKDYQKRINIILDVLEERIPSIVGTELDGIRKRLLKMNEELMWFEKNFPKVNEHLLGLGLAYDVDNEIDTIESIISEYGDATIPIVPSAVDKQIEKMVLTLTDIINSYANLSIINDYDIENLLKNATTLRILANDNKIKLEEAITDEEKFLILLKGLAEELKEYEEIKTLQDQIEAINDFQIDLTSLLNMSDINSALQKHDIDLTNYKNIKVTLNNKEEEIERNEQKYNELLEEMDFLLLQLEETITENKSIDELLEEINRLIEEIDGYTSAFEKYCK